MNVGFALESYGRQTDSATRCQMIRRVGPNADPDSVRGADLCFFSHDRWPRSRSDAQLLPFLPNMIVEVVFAGQSSRADPRKARRSTSIAGDSLVWIVYPKSHSVAIDRSSMSRRTCSRKTTSSRIFPSFPASAARSPTCSFDRGRSNVPAGDTPA